MVRSRWAAVRSGPLTACCRCLHLQWLTSSPVGGAAMVRQLPKTVGELERDLHSAAGGASYRDQLQHLLSGDSQNSTTVIKDWLKE